MCFPWRSLQRHGGWRWMEDGDGAGRFAPKSWIWQLTTLQKITILLLDNIGRRRRRRGGGGWGGGWWWWFSPWNKPVATCWENTVYYILAFVGSRGEDGTASGPRVQYKLVYEDPKEADAGAKIQLHLKLCYQRFGTLPEISPWFFLASGSDWLWLIRFFFTRWAPNGWYPSIFLTSFSVGRRCTRDSARSQATGKGGRDFSWAMLRPRSTCSGALALENPWKSGSVPVQK